MLTALYTSTTGLTSRLHRTPDAQTVAASTQCRFDTMPARAAAAHTGSSDDLDETARLSCKGAGLN